MLWWSGGEKSSRGAAVSVKTKDQLASQEDRGTEDRAEKKKKWKDASDFPSLFPAHLELLSSQSVGQL